MLLACATEEGVMCGFNSRSDADGLPDVSKSIRQIGEFELVKGFYCDMGES